MQKDNIQNSQKTIGAHINLNDIAVGRIAGYAFIWIDKVPETLIRIHRDL